MWLYVALYVVLYVALYVTGPGSALKMRFNVEKYEYTKELQTGVGIQVSSVSVKTVLTRHPFL